MIESYVVVPVPAGDRSDQNAPNGVTAAPVPKYGYYPSRDEARPLLPALLPTENAAPDAQKKRSKSEDLPRTINGPFSQIIPPLKGLRPCRPSCRSLGSVPEIA
ncbi:hypothetical protein Pelo_3746 [Pelomyxa schiedti]|nr:hypothetical protein Pelo_3746 [Pelomyxa schiedti]